MASRLEAVLYRPCPRRAKTSLSSCTTPETNEIHGQNHAARVSIWAQTYHDVIFSTNKSCLIHKMGENRSAKNFAVKGELPELTEIRHNFFETRRKGKPSPRRIIVLSSSTEGLRRRKLESSLASLCIFICCVDQASAGCVASYREL